MNLLPPTKKKQPHLNESSIKKSDQSLSPVLEMLSRITLTLFRGIWGGGGGGGGSFFSLNPNDDKTIKNLILNSVVTGLRDMTQL